jgi:hypothetical protein
MYIVLEIQTSNTVATLVNAYEDRNQAESKYHQILTAAALSSVPKHSAVLMNDEGQTIKDETYIHEVTE